MDEAWSLPCSCTLIPLDAQRERFYVPLPGKCNPMAGWARPGATPQCLGQTLGHKAGSAVHTG